MLWTFGVGFAAGAGGTAFGIGAALALIALTACFARAIARRGLFGGDPVIATIVVIVAALLAIFIFFPVGKALFAAVQDPQGRFVPALVFERLFTADIWSVDCLRGGARCGVAVNSAVLATVVGMLSTLLGLALALVVQRGGQRYAALLKLMSILPIITPPFVIALALVVLFGRTGLVTGWLFSGFGIPRTRWLYGLPGVTLAQLLSFSPIAFMILHGALSAVSPALEEAAQTLRATRGRVFRTVTWPLLRPALANAFLLGFVESLADFANPIVLSGNFEVLSTKIFFAVAGAQHDPGRAAVLASRAARLHARRVLAAAALARQAVVRDGQRQGRRRHAGAAAEEPVDRMLRHRRRCGSVHDRLLRRHLRRRIREGHRPRRHDAVAFAFRRRLRRRVGRARALLRRIRVGQPVHDDQGRRGVGPAHRGDGAPRRVRDHAPPFRRRRDRSSS